MSAQNEIEGTAPPKNRKPYKGMAMEGGIAKWYSKNQQKGIAQYRTWATLASAHITEGCRVLEIAPGPGYLSIELAKLGNYKIVGLDISKTFVKIATEKAREANAGVDFREGDAAYMPFPRNTFDFAICTSAFKNFPEPVRVLDEIFRVLKPEGEALIIDLRKDAARAGIDRYVDSLELGTIDSLVTKFVFKHMLLRSAIAKSELITFAARSRFTSCKIGDEEIGLEVWLKK